MDLISRQAAIDALGECPENWTDSPEEIEAVNSWCYAANAINSVPSIPAVPLDKLCECLVRKRIGFVDEVDGKRLTATLDKALWATLIQEWVEGLDAAD